MSALSPRLEGKQTLGELPENDAHDPLRKSSAYSITRRVPILETAPLPAPFLVHLRVDRPTLPGTGGSDPLLASW